MKSLKQEKGITLISLVVTVIVMMILTITINISMTSNTEYKKYNAVKEDVITLTEEVKLYYAKNETLPVDTTKIFSLTTQGVPTKDINPNDDGNYYPIDLSMLSENLDLNNGEGNKNKNYTSSDLYVLNETSLTVYYLRGATLNGEKHYTMTATAASGEFAEDIYIKNELPIISVVKMQSDGENENQATVGDTVTLTMIANYELTTKPTIVIDGTDVTSSCIWNGKIGKVKYQITSLKNSSDESKVGQLVTLQISNYKADSLSGSEITAVNFGTGVYIVEN